MFCSDCEAASERWSETNGTPYQYATCIPIRGGVANSMYLQRKHHRLLSKGRVSAAKSETERPDAKEISLEYVRRVRELREEGGEAPVA